MQSNSNRTLTIVVIAAAALLVGCFCGVLIGGLGATLIGSRSIEMGPESGPLPQEQVVPVPKRESLPGPDATPVVPGSGALSGAFVREVVPGSPAEDAGIRTGDFILRIDDVPLDANHRLADVLSQYSPGDRVSVEVLRADTQQVDSLQIRLDESATSPGKPYLGVFFMDVMP